MNTDTRIRLPMVDLVLCETRPEQRQPALDVIRHCQRHVEFGMTHFYTDCRNPRGSIEGLKSVFVHSVRIESNDAYSEWCVKQLPWCSETMTGTHTLIVQTDGFIVNPAAWDYNWLKYDYIGAPWSTPEDGGASERRVGNGGFSLRSRRLMQALQKLVPTWPDRNGMPEDLWICALHGRELEEHGIRFAPPDVAARFSGEVGVAESVGLDASFGFHGLRHGRENFLDKLRD